jgi:hypothetical protein
LWFSLGPTDAQRVFMRTSTWFALVFAVAGIGASGAAAADEIDASGEVRRVLDARRPDLCRCVEKGIDSGHLVPVTLKFDISPRGRAVNTEIEVPDDVSPAVARCLKKSVERIRFPEVTAFSSVEHRMSFLNTKLDRPRRH